MGVLAVLWNCKVCALYLCNLHPCAMTQRAKKDLKRVTTESFDPLPLQSTVRSCMYNFIQVFKVVSEAASLPRGQSSVYV